MVEWALQDQCQQSGNTLQRQGKFLKKAAYALIQRWLYSAVSSIL